MNVILRVSQSLIGPSGSLGPLGDGWIPLESYFPGIRDYFPVLKTQGLWRQKGRPFLKSYRRLAKEKGAVNAMALPWPSLTYFLKYRLPRVKRRCILSLHAKDAEEMAEIVAIILKDKARYPEKYKLIQAVEINLSCPNVQACIDILGILEAASLLPWAIIAKIGQHQVEEVLEAVRLGWAQGVTAINTIPWGQVFDTPSPLRHLGVNGAVSGKPIFLQALHTVYHLAYVREKEGLSFLIFGGGGIMDSASAGKMLDAGADRLVVGTLLTQDPIGAIKLALWWKKQIIRSLVA